MSGSWWRRWVGVGAVVVLLGVFAPVGGAGAVSGPVLVVALGSSSADVGVAASLVAGGVGDAVVLADSVSALGAGAGGVVSGSGAGSVLVVGGTAALSDVVVGELGALAGAGVGVERVWGVSRSVTSAAAAGRVLAGREGGVVVALANGWSLADVGAAAGLVAAGGADVLLFAESASLLGDAAVGVLGGADVERVVLVGGTAALSEGVRDAAAAAAGGAVTRRLSGATRAHTAAAAAVGAGLGCVEAAVVANGWSESDVGIAAGLVAAWGDSVVLYAQDASVVGDPAADALKRLAPQSVVLIGTTDTLSEEMRAQLPGGAAAVRVGDAHHAARLALQGSPGTCNSTGTSAAPASTGTRNNNGSTGGGGNNGGGGGSNNGGGGGSNNGSNGGGSNNGGGSSNGGSNGGGSNNGGGSSNGGSTGGGSTGGGSSSDGGGISRLYPATAPTVSFESMPAGHNGSSFGFSLKFSSRVGAPFIRLVANTLRVTGGSASHDIPEQEYGQYDSWTVTVRPSGTSDVTISLDARDCSGTHVLCDGSRDTLRGTPTATVIHQPSVEFAADRSGYEHRFNAVEGGAAVSVEVRLSAAVGAEVTVPIVASPQRGATTADYTLSATQVTFGPAETTKTVQVTAVDDSVHDGAVESVRLSFGTLPEQVRAGGRTGASVYLVDDDDSAEAFGHTPSKDIDFPHRSHTQSSAFDRPQGFWPEGLWSDGTSVWVLSDHGSEHVMGYDLATGDRKPGLDFELLTAEGENPWGYPGRGNQSLRKPRDLWSDGSTLYVMGSNFHWVVAYDISPGDTYSDYQQAKTHKVRTTLGTDYWPVGLWSDGDTFWLMGREDSAIAFSLADGTRSNAKDISILREARHNHTALWSDGKTIWVSNRGSGNRRAGKIYAFDLATGTRRPALEFDTLQSVRNCEPTGIWSDGRTMWVLESWNRKLWSAATGDHCGVTHGLFSYNMPVTASLYSLAVGDIDIGLFQPGTTSYTAAGTAGTVTVTAEAASTGTTTTIASTNGTGTDATGTSVALTTGTNTITVTTANGTDTRTYTVTITVP